MRIDLEALRAEHAAAWRELAATNADLWERIQNGRPRVMYDAEDDQLTIVIDDDGPSNCVTDSNDPVYVNYDIDTKKIMSVEITSFLWPFGHLPQPSAREEQA